jgi:hypothetical protein
MLFGRIQLPNAMPYDTVKNAYYHLFAIVFPQDYVVCCPCGGKLIPNGTNLRVTLLHFSYYFNSTTFGGTAIK